MAKFEIGDQVDWRNNVNREVERGVFVVGTTTVRVNGCPGIRLATPDSGPWIASEDDCIPHVPAPVVPPAPVDPLTGLTAQEMERRYSARLSAFGRGEPDPFAKSFLDSLHSDGESRARTMRRMMEVTGPERIEPLMLTQVGPRPFTIEDVKVGSRWVLKADPDFEVGVVGVEQGLSGRHIRLAADGCDWTVKPNELLSWYKPAPEAPAPPVLDIVHDSVWAAKDDPSFKVTVVGVPLFSNGHRVLLRRGGWSDWPVSRDQFLAEYKLLHTPAPPANGFTGPSRDDMMAWLKKRSAEWAKQSSETKR